MAVRSETRFGSISLVGTTYVSVGTVPSATTWNVLLHVANRTAGAVKLRAYIADSTWSTGEPTGTTFKATIAYDLSVSANGVIQISGFVMGAGEKLVVYADTASSLDVSAHGVSIA